MAFKWSLIPRDEQFFDLFKAMAEEIRLASLDLESMLATDPPDTSKVDAIRDAEAPLLASLPQIDMRTHSPVTSVLNAATVFSLAPISTFARSSALRNLNASCRARRGAIARRNFGRAPRDIRTTRHR